MYPIIRMAYGSTTKTVMEFKDKYPYLTDEDISQYYEKIKYAPVNKRETDLNKKCMKFILENLAGETVIDVACGRGALLKEISKKHPKKKLHGVDIVTLPSGINMKFTKASINKLPFKNKSFDTVLSTHVLEHVRNPEQALSELLRITKKRLIIVVPKQREYRYTTDLHVNFWPYLYAFQSFIGIEKAEYYQLDGDFVCVINS
jgi:ubiquinone/menaquinone biosynthesis C-methylase UbiE